MTVTYDTIEPVDIQTVKLAWNSDQTPPVPFRVYLGGVLMGSWTSPLATGEMLLSVPSGDAPFVEVLDRACQNPSIAFPGRLTLVWQHVAGAASYRVEEYVSAAWTERITITADGSSAYSWLSRWLEDVTTHQFRVIPVSAAGNDGTAVTFTALVVRHPDPPNVTYTYNGAGTPTVTIASA